MGTTAKRDIVQVSVVGAGGLGVSALWGLLTAPIRTAKLAVTVFDPDAVELSNLNRQVFFRTSDVGRPKAVALCERAAELLDTRCIELMPRQQRVERQSMPEQFAAMDLVIDACDCAKTKFELNDFCVLNRIPLCYAGVIGDSGMAMSIPGRNGSACLRCVFGELSADELAAQSNACRSGGIIGAAAGMVGFVQAELALELLTGETEARLFRIGGGPAVKSSAILASPVCPLGCGIPVHSRIDLKGKTCPNNFLYTKLALEQLKPGENLEVDLSSCEFAQSVAHTAGEEGNILLRGPQEVQANHWRVILQSKKNPGVRT